jgi:hypothetical protein
MLDCLLLTKVRVISNLHLSSPENIYCQSLKIPPSIYCNQVMQISEFASVYDLVLFWNQLYNFCPWNDRP